MPAYENLIQAALGTARTRSIDRYRIQVTASRQALKLTIPRNLGIRDVCARSKVLQLSSESFRDPSTYCA